MLRNSDSVNDRVYVKGLCESVSEGLHVLLRSVSEAQIRMSCSMYRIFWNPAVFLSEVVTHLFNFVFFGSALIVNMN